MKSKTKVIIFSLLILVLSISAVSAHENIIADGNNVVNDIMDINHFDDGLKENLDDLDDSNGDDDSNLDDEDYEDYDDWDDGSDLDDEDYEDYDDWDD
uniref:hypothetical protein n=1 Tax=Methanobrevibacter sp. TaxID=66852 RepID=UPI003866F3B6